MTFGKYQKLCKNTASKFRDKEKEIMTWGLGVAGEAGDVAGCIKKTVSHKDSQEAGIRENIGDTMWYLAMVCNFFNWDMEEIVEENIAKLKKRHPKGFSVEGCQKDKRRDWNE